MLIGVEHVDELCTCYWVREYETLKEAVNETSYPSHCNGNRMCLIGFKAKKGYQKKAIAKKSPPLS